jgi:hypothetical protein
MRLDGLSEDLEKMADQRRYDIWAILVTVLSIAAYASFRTEFRLREKMPVEFFDAMRVQPNKRAAEERIAKAYWQCAVKQIQWKYGYAHRLPQEAPAEFSLAAVQAGSGVEDPGARARYWEKLRAIWTVSSVWEKQYELNRISFSDSLRSGGAWLERHMRAIIGYS